MDDIRLPIDVVPGTQPPRFRWKQVVDTPAGRVAQEQEGLLPPSIERAVERLVTVAKQLWVDNVQLRGHVEGMSERIAAQAELLGRKAEAVEPYGAQPNMPKKGR